MDQTSLWLIEQAGKLVWPRVDLSVRDAEAVNGYQKFILDGRWVKVTLGDPRNYGRRMLFFENCPDQDCQGILVAILPVTNVLRTTPRVHFPKR